MTMEEIAKIEKQKLLAIVAKVGGFSSGTLTSSRMKVGHEVERKQGAWC